MQKNSLHPSAYGGILLKTRRGRSRGRPLSQRHSMHLVLRSSKARGAWSFKRKNNETRIRAILLKFSQRFEVKILALAVVGNHLHLQIKLSKLAQYQQFIRAVTAAIAMAVSGASRWKPLKKQARDRFWDHRPYTSIVSTLQYFKNLRDYIQVNQLEGFGYSRQAARFTHAWNSSWRLAPSRCPGPSKSTVFLGT